MAQPRPKPTAPRKVSTAGVKALVTAAALGLTIGSWAALSGQQPTEVVVDAAPIVTSALPSAPTIALSGPPIPTVVPLVASPSLDAGAGAAVPLARAPLPPAQPPAPALRPASPALSAPAVSPPRPQARTRSSR